MVDTLFYYRKVSKSFKKMQKRNSDKISPCQTPKVQLKRHDDPSLVVILDLLSWYRLYIILKHLPFILLSNILNQSPLRQTVRIRVQNR